FNYIPRIGGNVMLTTRNFIPPTKASMIHVEKMDNEDALHLLLSSNNLSLKHSPRELDLAQKIVTQLDCMPLAVDLARAYIVDTQTNLKYYLKMFEKKHDILLAYYSQDNDQYKHTVATVWQLSFEEIRQKNPVAAQILDMCAFLQPDNIPVIFFEKQSAALSISPTSHSE